MGFRDSVRALLDTYIKCLDLLQSASTTSGKTSGGTATVGDSRTALSLSLLDDRAKVQQAYAARLRETGSRLKTGDKRARSVLRRIVRRLTAALASLLGRSHDGSQAPLTYHALRALSNESRVGAIKTIDALSVRLSKSQSGRSTQTQRSNKTRRLGHSPSLSAASSPNAVPSQRTRSVTSSPENDHRAAETLHKQGREKKSRSKRPPGDTQVQERHPQTRKPQELPPKPKGKKHPSPRIPAPAPGPPPRAEHEKPRQPPHTHKDRPNHVTVKSSPSDVSSLPDLDSPRYVRHPNRRISQITSSSASTKLGEIPEDRQRHYPQIAVADPKDHVQGQGMLQYNVKPVYPVRLYPVPPPVEEDRRKGFWGRFRKT